MVSNVLCTRVIESSASRTPEERDMRADLKSVMGCWNAPGELERVSMLLLGDWRYGLAEMVFIEV